ncbi:heme lyase CcmF/NrfE family subunit [Vibrio sp. NH-UV-68]|uniref:heme lyase CcmF/NrfE family subunit n=1 Tax=unclassified Vibrio TaxID=2614977 RepID=UPI0036F37B5B
MFGEIGHFALVWIAISSSISSTLYAWQKWHIRQRPFSLSFLAKLNGAVALLSLVLLAYLFISDQFHFQYVASHSNSALPLAFKIAAVWGGHEGSMLFWVFTLALWSAFISCLHRTKKAYLQDVLWIMGLFVGVFAWFTLVTSNPFTYSQVWLEQGRDLNPMLQDVGLIFHPPLLYLGYIGFSTVLAFALAALMQPQINQHWVALARPWAVSAWAFLTLGILVGAWWAYNELGWGGWWFWDPVENASLLPWLTGTALLHALVAANHQQQQRFCALVLALVTFSLSILGTFIVRSGVLTSVHAFAVDPGKGITLLAIMVVTLIAGFSLLFMRAEQIISRPIVSIVSRNYLTLSAVGLLVVASFTVFLGTFYPMLYELFGLGAISVGAPYFNTLFTPLTLIALSLMGAVPFLKWQHGNYFSTIKMAALFAVCLSIGALLYWFQVANFSLSVALTWGLAIWVLGSHSLLALRQTRLSFMVAAHIGLAISAVGAMMHAEHSFELNRKMSPGSVVELTDGQINYQRTDWVIGPNYTAERAVLTLQQANKSYQFTPERRHYPVRVMNMSEPAIQTFWHGDYYITLGSKVDTHSYAVKIQYKSYMSWVWGGAIVAILGALMSLVKWQVSRGRYVTVEQV